MMFRFYALFDEDRNLPEYLMQTIHICFAVIVKVAW
jgi:hypothetical protein